MKRARDAVVRGQIDRLDVLHGRQTQFVETALIGVRDVAVFVAMAVFLQRFFTPISNCHLCSIAFMSAGLPKTNLQRWDEERRDQIKVPVDGLRMDRVVLLFLTGFADDLDRLDAVILLVAPVNDPYLVEMFDIEDVDGVSICHDDL